LAVYLILDECFAVNITLIHQM